MMDKTSLIKRLHLLQIAYETSCNALQWLVTEAQEAVDSSNSDIATLLSKSNAGVMRPGGPSGNTLSEQITAIAKHHQTMVNKARPILLQMGFIYRVALYDAYIRDVLETFLIHKPEMLKSGKSITHQEALEFSQAGTLVEHLAGKELDEFDRASIKDQVAWITNKFGFSILPRSSDLPTLIELMARRNLLVHSNGIVDAKYLRCTSPSSLKAGDRVDVPLQYLVEADKLLAAICQTMVASASTAFSL
jgi:hypothetical protein